MSRNICFLDMDGVIADFVGHTCKAHDLPSPYGDRNCQGIFEMEKCWGMTEEDFWKPLATFEFWADMPKTPEADDIVNHLVKEFGKDNICVLTNPSQYDGCISAKKEWIHRHYPFLAKQMLFGAAKQYLAGPNRFLVDDRDKNIIAFEEFGGRGITVPRDWNRMYHHKDAVMREVMSQLYFAKERD